jgi:shikimate dehydrogenase
MTDRYAVIGNPISHSKSPQIHQMFAAQTGQNISYEKIEAPLDGFAATIQRLRNEGYKGCSVTVPFKQEAYENALALGMTCELPATTAHAVNTYCLDQAVWSATNTDGIGLVRDIRNNLNFSLNKKRILLMGAGGAARGVLFPLMDQISHYHMPQQTPEIIVIANRTSTKATQIINERDFQLIAASNLNKPETIQLHACGYSELAGQQFDIVINATSAGLTDSTIPLPATIFAPNALAYDMMYGRETPFMKFSREHGAQVADGLGMLVEQAAEAFYLWRGVRPDTAPVIAKLRAIL